MFLITCYNRSVANTNFKCEPFLNETLLFMAIIENLRDFLLPVRILYLANITRLLVWNQGKIAIIKWVYFDVLKNALYFGVFKSCMQHKMKLFILMRPSCWLKAEI